MTVLTGAIIGSYRLIEPIGRGGMGEVYRAEHVRLGSQAAIKMLLRGLAGQPEFLARFDQEARSTASLQHPHILEVLDYGDWDGIPYLVMPYLPGGTLRDRLGRGPLPRGEAIRFLDALADALDYAHGQGIVHRDVKPANILLDMRGRPRLSDFGIAHAANDDGHLTTTGALIGTPEYMAPEQAQGAADGRADLYALAVIAYEMLVGRPPFQGKTSIEILLQHQQATVPLDPLRAVHPPLPVELEAVLQRALAKAPDERYQSGSSLAAAVAAALEAGRTGAATLAGMTTGELTIRTAVSSTKTGRTALTPARPPDRPRSITLVAFALGLALLMAAGVLAVALGLPGRLGSGTPASVGAVAPTPDSMTMTPTVASAPPVGSGGAAPLPPTATPIVEAEPRAGAVISGHRPTTTATIAAVPTPFPTASPVPAGPSRAEVEALRASVLSALLALPGTSSGTFIPIAQPEAAVADDPGMVLPAASIIKLAVAGAAYQRVSERRLDPVRPFTLARADKVGGTGILREQPDGTTYSLNQLVETMLVYSDNTATNMIIDRLGGIDAVNAFIVRQGLPNTRMRRKLADFEAQARGLENTTSSGDIAAYLQQLLRGQVVDRATSERILRILETRARQDPNWLLSQLPSGTRAAHISGTLPGVRGDAGIIWAGPQPYILVLFAVDSNERGMEEAIARASADVYRAVGGQ